MSGEDAYRAWVDRGGGFTDFEWKAMNVFDRARWEKFADAINEQHRGAVEALRNLYEDFRAGGQREATERVRMELAALGIETEPYGGR